MDWCTFLQDMYLSLIHISGISKNSRLYYECRCSGPVRRIRGNANRILASFISEGNFIKYHEGGHWAYRVISVSYTHLDPVHVAGVQVFDGEVSLLELLMIPVEEDERCV